MQIIKELEIIDTGISSHPLRRVVLLERANGTYAHAQQYYYEDIYEGELIAKGWATICPDGIYATAAIAETEARAAYSAWYRPIS